MKKEYVVIFPWENGHAFFGDIRYGREGGVARESVHARRYTEAKARRLAKIMGGRIKHYSPLRTARIAHTNPSRRRKARRNASRYAAGRMSK